MSAASIPTGNTGTTRRSPATGGSYSQSMVDKHRAAEVARLGGKKGK